MKNDTMNEYKVMEAIDHIRMPEEKRAEMQEFLLEAGGYGPDGKKRRYLPRYILRALVRLLLGVAAAALLLLIGFLIFLWR